MLRTLQTSAQISQQLNLTFTPQSELREIYFGDLETRGWDNFQKIAPETYQIYHNRNRDFNYPNGESGQDAFHRVYPFIKQIIQEDQKKVVIVAHGGIIRVLLCGLLNLPFGNRFTMGNPIFNCNLSTLLYNSTSGNFKLQEFNSIAHLPVELRTG
jgi:broad specificity phosphatase PhoE